MVGHNYIKLHARSLGLLSSEKPLNGATPELDHMKHSMSTNKKSSHHWSAVVLVVVVVLLVAVVLVVVVVVVVVAVLRRSFGGLCRVGGVIVEGVVLVPWAACIVYASGGSQRTVLMVLVFTGGTCIASVRPPNRRWATCAHAIDRFRKTTDVPIPSSGGHMANHMPPPKLKPPCGTCAPNEKPVVPAAFSVMSPSSSSIGK